VSFYKVRRVAESTLSVDLDFLRRVIGIKAGYGRDPSLWTGDKAYRLTDVDDAIRSGLLRIDIAHDWQFLKTTLQIDLVEVVQIIKYS
jgi:hypothetical protein